MFMTEITPAEDSLGAELLALQKAAYAVEAEIIGDDRIPPLHESLADLRAQPLRWLGAVDEDGRLAGAVAWEETAGEVDVNRLVVHPGALRRGIGRALVKEVLARAGARRVVVSTGRDNTPARTLYERLGFALVGEAEVIPGLWIAHYALPA
ncbi:GNAT family N-acetyltransferase [Nonomuraea sp. NPDC049480]|uniref:GNAT family N-acetyltransferase n=1 Tax=Nonomuraea sp. NPDC049480 TaxID=3364353 RepID=UPI003799A339